jgi:maleylpyruvate isomerase
MPEHLRPGEVGMSRPQTLDWWADGERLLGTALGRLTDEEFDAPSLLPGWTRHYLLAHVARNADALVNLLNWARTGVETPMYASVEAREAGIAEAATLSPAELRTEVLAATGRLADAVHGLPDEAWSAGVRTAQGRDVPAAEVPWMRCREVYVHAVDLDAGVGFGDVAEEVQAAIIDDVFRMWDRRDQVPDVVVFAGDREWGTGSVAVSGPLPAVTAWLTGRTRGEGLTADGGIPAVPAWL